ncbi:Protein CBG08248 [Caenorhabditis briggsae]|uniref:Protein CBG08248 n=1 Tax=Caenorhabditis briggsae TaxID=6238 RepID=A8X649_CAEBR|nr:Protein CBG08248 [Caenorhabditis briggsae]CAP28110.1 Protein CBG08248 [Caenorhabditis briggsae]
MKKGGARLQRKDSDEWLCSSTYQPNRDEILQKSEEKKTRKKKRLKIAVVVPMKTSVTPKSEVRHRRRFESPPKDNEIVTIDEGDDADILNFVSTSKANPSLRTPTSSMANIKIVSPMIPKSVSSIRSSCSPPILQIRQSPEQLFAALTPKRRTSFEVAQPAKRRKEEQDPFEDVENYVGNDSESDQDSDISNVFETLSPIKTQFADSLPKFSLDFITGYEAQFTAFEDTQPPIENDKNDIKNSPDLFDDLEDPMSIYEESEAREIECSPMNIEASPEKPRKVTFKFFDSEEVKAVKKGIGFVEPESLWRKENFIEESCAQLQSSVYREYAIDAETCGMSMAESSDLPDETTQKYLTAQSCSLLSNSLVSDSQDEEMYDRDELFGLSARLASLMSSKTSERRLLMSDVVFGTVPKEKLIKLELSKVQSAFGMTILDTSTSLRIINRSSAIRRLASTTAVPCSSLSPALVCDPAPQFHLPPAATSTISLLSSSLPPPTLASISTIFSIGALSSSSDSVTTTTIEDCLKGSIQVLINPPLVIEGAL